MNDENKGQTVRDAVLSEIARIPEKLIKRHDQAMWARILALEPDAQGRIYMAEISKAVRGVE